MDYWITTDTYYMENTAKITVSFVDLTAKYAIKRSYYGEKIKLIERITKESDEYLYPYILKAVTEGLSYTYLKTRLEMPCSRDMYYDRYRRFFWLLSRERN